MKYKIGDMVYFKGNKYKVVMVGKFGLGILTERGQMNVFKIDVKPIVRCSNGN